MDLGTAEFNELPAPLPRGFAAWQAAWRELDENPLARYMLLAEQRRSQRGKRRRAFTYFLLIACLAALWFIMLGGVNYSVVSDWHELFYWAFSFISLVYAIWFVECISATVRDALQVLAPPQKLTSSLALDDTLATSGLSHEDIVLGVLRILLPPLWLRGVVGSALLWAAVLLLVTEGLSHWNAAAGKLVVLMPLGAAFTALSSVLGALAFVLFYLAASQTQHVLALSTGAAVSTLVQLAWVAAGPALAYGETMAFNEIADLGPAQALGLVVAGLALCACLMGVAVLRGRYHPSARAVNAVLGPWLAPALLLIGIFIWQISTEFNGSMGHEEELGMLFLGFLQGWGFMLPLNTGAIHSALFTGVLEARPGMYWQLLCIPAEFALQLGLVAVLAWAARDSVRRRRTEGAGARG